MPEKIKHIVLLDFKPDVAEPVLAKFRTSIKDLKTKLPGIESIQIGEYKAADFAPAFKNDYMDLTQGRHMCCEMIFTSAEHLAAYVPHAEHMAVIEQIKPILSDVPNPVQVLDYVITE